MSFKKSCHDPKAMLFVKVPLDNIESMCGTQGTKKAPSSSQLPQFSGKYPAAASALQQHHCKRMQVVAAILQSRRSVAQISQASSTPKLLDFLLPYIRSTTSNNSHFGCGLVFPIQLISKLCRYLHHQYNSTQIVYQVFFSGQFFSGRKKYTMLNVYVSSPTKHATKK